MSDQEENNNNDEPELIQKEVDEIKIEKPKKVKLSANEARRNNLAKGRAKKLAKAQQKKEQQVFEFDNETESDSSDEEIVVRKRNKKQNNEVPTNNNNEMYDLRSEILGLKRQLQKQKKQKDRKTSNQIIINPAVHVPQPQQIEDKESIDYKSRIFGFSRN